jgi:hypothetical protein
MGDLIDAHRHTPKSDIYRGLIVKVIVTVTDADVVNHSVCRRLALTYEPIVRIYLPPDKPLPVPGRYICTARVDRAETSPGDRGLPDVPFTLILLDGCLSPVE